MKKLIVLAGILAVAATSPVLAKTVRHHAVSKQDPASAQALAPSVNNGRGHIIVQNCDQGTDPDQLIRLSLQIDRPVCGG